jgi:hypothetical protein
MDILAQSRSWSNFRNREVAGLRLTGATSHSDPERTMARFDAIALLSCCVACLEQEHQVWFSGLASSYAEFGRTKQPTGGWCTVEQASSQAHPCRGHEWLGKPELRPYKLGRHEPQLARSLVTPRRDAWERLIDMYQCISGSSLAELEGRRPPQGEGFRRDRQLRASAASGSPRRTCSCSQTKSRRKRHEI